jgi:5-methylcytosine-specific restriction endonuclease McrA
MKKKDVTSKSILKDRICAVCGNKFDVKLEDNNSIPIQYFYSKELGKTLTGNKTEYWECEYWAVSYKSWLLYTIRYIISS